MRRPKPKKIKQRSRNWRRKLWKNRKRKIELRNNKRLKSFASRKFYKDSKKSRIISKTHRSWTSSLPVFRLERV
jgi:hypothetical protein